MSGEASRGTRFVRLAAGHLEELRLQPAQAAMAAWIDRDYVATAISGSAWAALEGERVLGCAGLVQAWPERWIAWSLLGECGPRHFLSIHLAVRRVLAAHPAGRIETTVASRWKAAHRWVRALGFEREGTLRRYAHGEDHDLYARIG